MDARKQKDSERLSVLQMLLSQIKNEQINSLKKELTDQEIVAVLKKFVKQQKDAMSDFEKGGRSDLVDSTAREISLVSLYIPEEMSEAEIEVIAKKTLESLAITDPKDFGKAMGAVMRETKGTADGTLVQSVVKKLLSST